MTHTNHPVARKTAPSGVLLWALTGLGLVLLSGCTRPDEYVSVDRVYWAAVTSPESFDTELDAMVLDNRTAACLRRHRDRALRQENNQLRECAQILQGSPAWNACHEEAESYGNQAVFFNDIAGAVAGPGRFDESQAYAILVISKSLFTPSEWTAFAQQLREATPEFRCHYKGEEEFIWE